jgi:Mitochondrial carrier protein.
MKRKLTRNQVQKSSLDKTAPSESKKTYPQWHNVIAGATAGAGARLFTAPLDLLKIRRQLQSTTTNSSAPNALKLDPFGLFKSMRQIVQTEGGLHSLFRGNLAATYLWIGYAAVQFSLYARTADFLTSLPHTTAPPIDPLNLPAPSQNFPSLQKSSAVVSDVFSSIGSNPTAVAFCAGATAGTAATLATYPFDICRTAFASQRTMSQGSKSISAFFYQAMRDNPMPLRTLFAGSGPAVLGIVPYMGLNFALYDYLVRKGDRVNVRDAGAAGAISGGVSKLVVYPLDTIKKRLQAQAFETFWGGGENVRSGMQYKNMLDCGLTVFRDGGGGSFLPWSCADSDENHDGDKFDVCHISANEKYIADHVRLVQ